MFESLKKYKTVKIEKPIKKDNKLEILRDLFVDGLNKQIDELNKIIANPRHISVRGFKRWYQPAENGYNVFLKYQNKPVPCFGGADAVFAETLEEVRQVYFDMLEELKKDKTIKELADLISMMKIAKGAKRED